ASIEGPAGHADPAEPGSVAVPTVDPTPDPVLNAANPRLLGKDPYDDLNLGRKYFRSANFGLAEKHFRRAVESHPRDTPPLPALPTTPPAARLRLARPAPVPIPLPRHPTSPPPPIPGPQPPPASRPTSQTPGPSPIPRAATPAAPAVRSRRRSSERRTIPTSAT